MYARDGQMMNGAKCRVCPLTHEEGIEARLTIHADAFRTDPPVLISCTAGRVKQKFLDASLLYL